MSYRDHLQSSANTQVRCAIITFSDTRTTDNDSSGKKIAELLAGASHPVAEHLLLKENPALLHPTLWRLIERKDIDAILTTGGTGISRRDQTVSIIEKLIDQPLPGFGELFRQLSYAQIGSGAMLSRAIAGIAQGKVIFAMPGSTAAVELAMTKLILPEIRHLVGELRK
jgi:molybdenum cofactor biosynthesis protein B